MDNQNVDFVYPWNFFADAHVCVVYVYNLTSALYLAINNHFCVIRVPIVPASRFSVSFNVRFTTNGICSKTCNHIYVARTNEDLSPYICNVCRFLGTNYCIRKRWLTGPLQQSLSPLAQTSGYATAHTPMKTHTMMKAHSVIRMLRFSSENLVAFST